MAKNFKFPDPNDYPPKSPAVLCPSERVLNLYNQDSGHRADRVSKKVKLWFAQEAHARDWAGVRFLPEVQTQHTAGAILWQPPRVQITVVTRNMLVLAETDDDDGD
jgi:hypothetical protein